MRFFEQTGGGHARTNAIRARTYIHYVIRAVNKKRRGHVNSVGPLRPIGAALRCRCAEQRLGRAQVGAGDDIGIPCVCIKSSDFDAHLDKSDAIVTLRM